MAVLDLDKLSAGYENGFVIHDISLSVEPGEFLTCYLYQLRAELDVMFAGEPVAPVSEVIYCYPFVDHRLGCRWRYPPRRVERIRGIHGNTVPAAHQLS